MPKSVKKVAQSRESATPLHVPVVTVDVIVVVWVDFPVDVTVDFLVKVCVLVAVVDTEVVCVVVSVEKQLLHITRHA